MAQAVARSRGMRVARVRSSAPHTKKKKDVVSADNWKINIKKILSLSLPLSFKNINFISKQWQQNYKL